MSYTWQYWLNLALVALLGLSIVGNVIVAVVPNGAWLGLSDIQWHWTLLVIAVINGLNVAFNHTPPVTHPPTTARLQVENQVDQIRKTA